MVKIMKILSVFLVTVFFLTSCGFAGNGLSADDLVNTSVAQTLSPLNASPQPQGLPTLNPIQNPTITPQALPTLGQDTAIPTQDACFQADWVEDVTVADGSIFLPNVAFTKTWRIQNVGTCTWNSNYTIVLTGGHPTGAVSETSMPGTVVPGGMVDVSVNITSPADNGTYKWEYKLRSDTGVTFGFGANYVWPITAEIEVAKFQIIPLLNFGAIVHLFPFENLVYDFSAQYCSAIWQNGLTDLPCPGGKTDAAGFIVRNDDVKLQDGTVHSGAAIFTHPRWVNNGLIKGIYPKIQIENGYHFKATIGCASGGTACDVIYEVLYQESGNPIKLLQQWVVVYSGSPVEVDIDLSSLAGKKVAFTLLVSAHGSSAQDWAHWVNPRIVK